MKEKLKKLPIQIAVRAIITNEEQKVILIKRALGTFEGGKWCLIGGKPDGDEDLEKAIARETQEEVGVQFSLTPYVEQENPDTDTGVRWITHYFVGTSNNLPTQFDPREVSEAAFFSQAELEELDIAFDHKDILMRYFKKE
ncbi:MAG: NUDIX hydrolase [Patescibacteria group bacterium]